jgi:hypothetical protein
MALSPAALVDSIAGIVEAAPSGTMVTEGSWTVIGTVILRPGKVLKVPRHGLNMEQSVALAAFAEAVWLKTGAGFYDWRFHPKLGWMIEVRIDARRTSGLPV